MAPSRRPLIALLTDFGQRDPYVSAMKMVILSRCDAEIVDLSHEIGPQDVMEAAFFLRFTIRNLDAGRHAIFVCVVDPGVGSSRRILAASRHETTILAPDNGLALLSIDDSWDVRSLENDSLFLPSTSSTFHGRDRFAPASAALAMGIDPARLGPQVKFGDLQRLHYDPPQIGVDEVRGTIIAIDRFGNAITDVEPAVLGNPTQWVAMVGWREIRDHADTYAEKEDSAEPFLIAGSRGTFEISIARASAADALQLRRLESIVFRRAGSA